MRRHKSGSCSVCSAYPGTVVDFRFWMCRHTIRSCDVRSASGGSHSGDIGTLASTRCHDLLHNCKVPTLPFIGLLFPSQINLRILEYLQSFNIRL